ncbi:hypothetical protein C621_0221875 [Bacillus thuringiensis serovar aizawai str. Leapi01]|nr:hypothetical protein C623_0234180 [Bacillus thuringiensis serovar aizawai str. Hu4-2]ETE90158.1 hypothetical protein C621_0221875 [Bacillus thuringiensis serovar aizawai str. Leapi01]KLA36329.1 hypothetical protein B4158_5773 [Bacillus cereus]
MLYVVGFIVMSIVAIRLNIKYYKLKGSRKDIVMKMND